MALLGLNMIATIITMRAPGLTWSRLPIFVWSVFATSILMVLAAPVLIATLLMAALDRTIDTSFFVAGGGGSSYLFENLFWFFGHPEVYILALPGFGIVLELLPVFTRKPLWGYRLAVAGHARRHAAELLRLAAPPVRQRHQRRPAALLHALDRDHLDPDRVHLPVRDGHAVEGANRRFTVPMLFCLAWSFNFLIGGLSGVFLSDAPSDTDTHGSFFVMAHFHYTIMGGLIFAFFAAIYYWVPKMTGLRFNERLAKVHFWLMFVSFNSTFLPLFALGMKGMPRRVVTYAPNLQGAQRLGLDLGLRARLLDADLPRQRRLLADLRAPAGRGQPVALEVARVAAAHAGAGPQLRADPGVRLRPLRLRHAGARRRRRASRCRREADDGSTSEERPLGLMIPPVAGSAWRSRPSRRTSARARSPSPRGCWPAPRRSSSWRSCSPTSTCARSTPTHVAPAHVNPSRPRRRVHRLRARERGAHDRRRAPDEARAARLARRRRSAACCSAWPRSCCSASSTRSQHFGPADGAYASVFCALDAPST